MPLVLERLPVEMLCQRRGTMGRAPQVMPQASSAKLWGFLLVLVGGKGKRENGRAAGGGEEREGGGGGGGGGGGVVGWMRTPKDRFQCGPR